jgi:hypothetical protein
MRVTLVNILQFLAAPLRFIFFASAVGALSKNKELLLVIGLLPLFSLIDVAVQSASRWGATLGSAMAISALARFGLGASSLFMFALASIFGGAEHFYIASICVAYVVNSICWRYEASFASRPLILLASILEISVGSIALLLLHRVGSMGIAVLLACTFPISRAMALALVGSRDGGVIARKPRFSLRTYMLLNFIPQLIAALASSLPSLIQILMTDHADFSSVLVTVKFLHSSSAMLSIFVNVYASRIFYGTMGNRWSRLQNRLILAIESYYKYCAMAFLFVIPVSLLNVSTIAERIALLVFSVPLLATSNLVSSLALANNLPEGAAYSQLVVFFVTATVCAVLYDSILLALLSVLVLSVVYLKYQIHIPKMLICKNEEENNLAH